MMTRLVVATATFALCAGIASAQTRIERAPIRPVPASDAKLMFETYCAVCHGQDAKGNGPAAVALKQAPADLTRTSARNGGKFPDVKISRFIEGLEGVPAHGTRDMPIWGDLFRSLNRDTAPTRVYALVEYLKTLQQ